MYVMDIIEINMTNDYGSHIRRSRYEGDKGNSLENNNQFIKCIIYHLAKGMKDREKIVFIGWGQQIFSNLDNIINFNMKLCSKSATEDNFTINCTQRFVFAFIKNSVR